jgi:hypothetical protein
MTDSWNLTHATRPWWPLSMFQQKTSQPPSLFQQELGSHKVCSKKIMAATKPIQ